MDPNAKLAFIHQRNSWYLPYALYHARHVSPHSEVVLLGESKCENITCIPMQEFADSLEVKDFKKNYIHMNHNPEWYELICFLRWFYLLQYMRSRHAGAVFYQDSDVLLYSSMQEMARESSLMGQGVGRGACLFREEGATAGISYWTREGLEEFCQTLLDCYAQEKHLSSLKDFWKPFVEHGHPGGVCDMTILTLFYSAGSRMADLTKIGGGVFDCNINQSSNYGSNEYVMDRGMKKIIFRDGLPYFEKNDPSQSLVRAHALHFQGKAKGYMPIYYRGEHFKNKILADLTGSAYRVRGNFKK